MKVICCLCGNEVSRTEVDPLVMDIRSEGTDKDFQEGVQTYCCHARCLEEKLYDKDVPFMWFSDTD